MDDLIRVVHFFAEAVGSYGLSGGKVDGVAIPYFLNIRKKVVFLVKKIDIVRL